ncbi:MAG: PQQ-binding-like beta-propeller repeat protein, partial [Pseudomonadota bacterium]
KNMPREVVKSGCLLPVAGHLFCSATNEARRPDQAHAAVRSPGLRIPVSGIGRLTVLCAGLVTVVTTAGALPAESTAADWPQSRHDARNSGAIELVAPASRLPIPWSFDGSGRVWGYEPGMTVWSPAAVGVVDGHAIVVVGSYDRNIYCLDAATGERLWTHTTGGPVFSAPSIWHDRDRDKVWVFVGANDRMVYALDPANGRQRWVHSVAQYRPTLGGARLSTPVVGQAAGKDAVFVGHWVWDSSLGHNLQRASVTALAIDDGKPIWSREVGDNQLTAPVFAVIQRRGLLFVGSSDGRLLAIDAADGSLRWTHTELDAVRGPPAYVHSDAGPLLVMASRYGMIRGLDAQTGKERWHWKTGDRITGSPSVAGRLAFVGSYDRNLYALDLETGSVKWRYQAKGGFYSSPAVASGGGEADDGDDALVLASAWDNMLHAVALRDGTARFLTFTGRPLWDVAGLDESNWSSPVAARVNGHWMAYVGSYDGVFRALPLGEEDRGPVALRSNARFWASFPLTLGPVALLAIMLTWRERQRRRRCRCRCCCHRHSRNEATSTTGTTP